MIDFRIVGIYVWTFDEFMVNDCMNMKHIKGSIEMTWSKELLCLLWSLNLQNENGNLQ